MGHYEDQLNDITAGLDWDIENARVLSLALGELQRVMKTLADAPGWEGKAADNAKEAFLGMQKKYGQVQETVDAIQETVTKANTYRNTVTGGADLPSAEVDPYWRTAVTVGATVVYPGLGTLAADKALDLISGFLGNKREDAAKQKVESMQKGLEEHRQELEKSRMALEQASTENKFDDSDPTPTPTPTPTPGPSYGGGGGSLPSYPSGGGSFPTTTVGDPGTSHAELVGFGDSGPGNDYHVPTHDTHVTHPVDPGTGGGLPPVRTTPSTPSVDGGVNGSLPPLPGGGSGGSYGGGSFGSGGTTGSGVLGAGAIGGGSAAALLAGSKMAGNGAAGLGGGSFGGAGGIGGMGGAGGIGGSGAFGGANGAAGARSTGGLLGQSGEAAAGARGAGAGASGSGTGAAGGRPNMMMGGQGQGGSEEKQKGQGLGGPMAPKLEDDEQSGPRSKGAGAGGRS